MAQRSYSGYMFPSVPNRDLNQVPVNRLRDESISWESFYAATPTEQPDQPDSPESPDVICDTPRTDEVEYLMQSTTTPGPYFLNASANAESQSRLGEGPTMTALSRRYSGTTSPRGSMDLVSYDRINRFSTRCAAALPPFATFPTTAQAQEYSTIQPRTMTLDSLSINPSPQDRLVLLTPEEQAHLRSYYHTRVTTALRAQSTAQLPTPLDQASSVRHIGPTRILPWNEKPLFSQQQLAAFTAEDWEKRVFRPFKIMTDKKRLGVALRFLPFILMVPNDITIPAYLKQATQDLGIGRNHIDVATFFFRDLPYLYHHLPPYLKETDMPYSSLQIDQKIESRTFHNHQMMQYYP